MAIYVLVLLSFTAICWVAALARNIKDSSVLFELLMILANILAIIFQTLSL